MASATLRTNLFARVWPDDVTGLVFDLFDLADGVHIVGMQFITFACRLNSAPSDHSDNTKASCSEQGV